MDRAYEDDETRQTSRDVGLKPTAPTSRNLLNLSVYNDLCKHRSKVARFFRRVVEDFRRIATRYDKLDVMFSAFLNFVTIVIFLNR